VSSLNAYECSGWVAREAAGRCQGQRESLRA
jgi:hypothetical protein